MEEDWDRLNHAIDRRFQIEDAFIQAMAQEFQRIQQELNKCIARHPDDPQLARVGEDSDNLGSILYPIRSMRLSVDYHLLDRYGKPEGNAHVDDNQYK